MKTLLSILTAAAVTLSFSVAGSAFDHHGDKKGKMKDPMARAEMQCENARKEAAEGSDEDKAAAEEKCTRAMEKAKSLMEKKSAKAAAKAEKKAKKAKKDKKDKDDDDEGQR